MFTLDISTSLLTMLEYSYLLLSFCRFYVVEVKSSHKSIAIVQLLWFLPCLQNSNRYKIKHS